MPRHGDEPGAVPRRRPPPALPGAFDGAFADRLLAAAGRGDVRALGALYDQTAPVVFGLLRVVLGESEQAEQATQRVYLRLWRAAPRFDPRDGSAASLLLRTACRELIRPVCDSVTRSEVPSDSGAAGRLLPDPPRETRTADSRAHGALRRPKIRETPPDEERTRKSSPDS